MESIFGANLLKMLRIGIIKERKVPQDERVPFTPKQCAYLQATYPNIQIVVEPSTHRSYKNEEFIAEGVEMSNDLSNCDVLIGIKEVPAEFLIPGKTYFFFSHTKKKQPHNQKLMHGLIEKKVRMIDYECLTHEDGQRILGFGYFAGIVGAHNGIRTYGKKFGLFDLPPAHKLLGFKELIQAYEHIELPNIKMAFTGTGRVASGVLDMMIHLEVERVNPSDFLTRKFDYPVYTQIGDGDLFTRRDNGEFHMHEFFARPHEYKCLFPYYITETDILMNGIYWDKNIDRLFQKEDIKRKDWAISVISDITCDVDGSVPINVGSTTISDPVYGIDRATLERTAPYQNTKDIIDIMAVDNLPNELPRDASHYFGTHLEKYVLHELFKDHSDILMRATICENGKLTPRYEFLADYAY